MTNEEIANRLNCLYRYSLETDRHGHERMREDPFGDYIDVRSLRDAFDLTLDSVFSEARGTAVGFRAKE